MRVGIDCQGRVRGNGNEVETMDIRKTKIDSLRPALYNPRKDLQLSMSLSTDKYECPKCGTEWYKVRHVIVEWVEGEKKESEAE